jgi:hypothetical protein
MRTNLRGTRGGSQWSPARLEDDSELSNLTLEDRSPSEPVRAVAKAGETRHLVEFRVGGSGERVMHGGSFATLREARLRRTWIAGKLAAMRYPDVKALLKARATVDLAADRWLASRRDVREGTRKTYDVALGRLRPRIGTLKLSEVTPAQVNELVEELVAAKLERESIRKT